MRLKVRKRDFDSLKFKRFATNDESGSNGPVTVSIHTNDTNDTNCGLICDLFQPSPGH